MYRRQEISYAGYDSGDSAAGGIQAQRGKNNEDEVQKDGRICQRLTGDCLRLSWIESFIDNRQRVAQFVF